MSSRLLQSRGRRVLPKEERAGRCRGEPELMLSSSFRAYTGSNVRAVPAQQQRATLTNTLVQFQQQPWCRPGVVRPA
jgi:hypothetical protein